MLPDGTSPVSCWALPIDQFSTAWSHKIVLQAEEQRSRQQRPWPRKHDFQWIFFIATAVFSILMCNIGKILWGENFLGSVVFFALVVLLSHFRHFLWDHIHSPIVCCTRTRVCSECECRHINEQVNLPAFCLVLWSLEHVCVCLAESQQHLQALYLLGISLCCRYRVFADT